MIVADALLGMSAAAMLLASFALLRLRGAYDRLHCVGFATLTGPSLAAGALIAAEGLSDLAAKAVLTFLIAAATGAVLTHATGRAFRRRQERRGQT